MTDTAVLSDDDLLTILRMYDEGKSYGEIADAVGIEAWRVPVLLCEMDEDD